jgi:hypothetical protein
MSGPHGGLGDLFEAAGKHSGEHRVLVVLGVAGLAVALILAAFFVGRGVAESSGHEVAPVAAHGSDADTLAEAAVGGDPGNGPGAAAPGTPAAATPSASAAAPNGRLLGRPFRGPVRPAAVSGVHASCKAEASVDAGGNPVRYPADNTLDGAATTAWRCPGDGSGVTLTFHLQRPQRIAQVGLVPGYAKTDPYSGVDRYAENRRIARVRWSFDGGTWTEQTFRTGRWTRSLQTLRTPPVRTRRVTLTIQDSVSARRNTVAVSTAHLAVAGG